MRIFHYTTIDVLALILSSKTIKFNRLDNVDDIDESKITFEGTPLSHIYFASCWSLLEAESIPMWRLYTNNGVGVRIAINSESLFNPIFKNKPTEAELKIQYDRFANPHYFDSPIIMDKPINYVDDPIKEIIVH